MAQIVKFNIGGQRYDVSRSLLQMYPNSMLTTSASRQWQHDPDKEIFIQRNGTRFQYVLDYLQDGKVSLPITESKETLMTELEYYGIAVTNGEGIDESATEIVQSISSTKKAYSYLLGVSAALKAERDEATEDSSKVKETEYLIAQMAADLYRLYLGCPEALTSKSTYNLTRKFKADEEVMENADALRTLRDPRNDKTRDKINVHLSKVGLHLSDYTWWDRTIIYIGLQMVGVSF